MLTIRLALAACVFLAPLPSMAQTSEPATTITALIKLDSKGDWTPIFANEPTATMQRFFTPGFNAAWRAAMQHNKDYPVFDSDPLTGAQGSGGPILKSTAADPHGVVTAIVASRDIPAVQVMIRYVMVRAGERWQIDDIVYPNSRPSLRAVLGNER